MLLDVRHSDSSAEGLSPKFLRSIYFGKFHSLLRYGIIFWGDDGDSNRVLKMQKRVLRIMSGIGKHESCRHIQRVGHPYRHFLVYFRGNKLYKKA
jgi:hypothetical protein